MISTLKISLTALTSASALIAAPIASAQMPMDRSDLSQYMPSQDEMRKILADAGLSPDKIEKEMKNLYPGGVQPPGDKPTSPPTPCTDENENDVCDEEENDSEITECRTSYLNVINKHAFDNYGDYLGSTASEVTMTCLVTAGHGAEYVEDGALLTDLEKLRSLADYWTGVMRYVSYIDPLPADLESALFAIGAGGDDLERVHAALPPAMQDIMSGDSRDTGETRRIGLSVHSKCESIRRHVGGRYRTSVLDNAVCLQHVPPAEDEEMPSDE